MADKQKILAGRNQVDAYRTAHSKLYDKGWHKGIPENHTPLLKALVNALEGLGFTSTETEFGPKKTEILAKFWSDSEELNTSELNKMYLQEGECNGCGKCCEGCQHHLGDGVCAIYENRPQDCVEYPTARDFIKGLPKECSYSFTRTTYQTAVDVEWS